MRIKLFEDDLDIFSHVIDYELGEVIETVDPSCYDIKFDTLHRFLVVEDFGYECKIKRSFYTREFQAGYFICKNCFISGDPNVGRFFGVYRVILNEKLNPREIYDTKTLIRLI